MEHVTRLLHEGRYREALIEMAAIPGTIELQAVLNSAMKRKKTKALRAAVKVIEDWISTSTDVDLF